MTTDILLHSFHLLFAIFWFGALLWTELILWPRMRAIGALETVQGGLRGTTGRKLMAVAVVGTVITGYARGVAAGVFDRLYTPYGIMFLVSSVVGFAMLTWWATFPPRSLKLGWRMFYSGFWVLFAMMVGMHFYA